ncbi:hypothetical protein [Flavobacterium sp. 1355]|nr:hypothetical protein [Flavobacterium sp. 1355]MBP1222476.1 hypothetical protein [Flavobacterium sp. 1355]
MNKIVVNKKSVIESVAKMAEDKAIVRSYLKGNIPLESLKEKGITLAKPL